MEFPLNKTTELINQQAASQTSTPIDWHLITQLSEPILFPKLQIQFADFPNLLYSDNQRLHT